MLVGIHQPHYLPWLRYMEKVARCDVFIVLDTVHYTKNGWQNRNKVKTANGVALLTVPVRASMGDLLSDVEIDDGPAWRRKHLMTIRQGYGRCLYYADYAAFLAETYSTQWRHLADLDVHMLRHFAETLGIGTRIVRASELEVPGAASERLVNLLKAVGGTRYYSGAFAMEQYLDPQLFAEAGIDIELQEWTPPVYSQQHGDFVPDLSIIDMLMNCGPDSLGLLLGAAR